MSKLNIFFKLTKVDVAQRTVEGIATAEVPDKSGEICDYASTKPLYEKWSAEISKASGGKSLGNVREMHGNSAAGKVVNMIFDDVAKAIRIVAKIVDDAAWNKVVEGVYTGFSHGGEYVKRWADGEFMRYTAEPFEVSIVDNPCLGVATFEVIKADGSREDHKFKSLADVGAPVQKWETTDGKTFEKKSEAIAHQGTLDADAFAVSVIANVIGKREFTDEQRKELADKGHAMPDGSFPIENKGDLENAVQAFGRAKDKEKAKAHITARAKDLDAMDTLPADWEGSTKKDDKAEAEKVAAVKEAAVQKRTAARADIKKFSGSEAWDAQTALDALLAIECLLGGEMFEAATGENEGEQAAMLMTVIEHLKAFIAAEIMEGTREDGSLARAARGGLTKAEHAEHVEAIHKAASHIMNSAMKCMGKDMEMFVKSAGEETAAHVTSMHKKAADICNRCMKMGSKFKNEEGDAGEQDESSTKFIKSLGANIALQKALDENKSVVEELAKRIKHLEAQPAARKGALFSVSREGAHESAGDQTVEGVEKVINYSSLRLSPEQERALQQF